MCYVCACPRVWCVSTRMCWVWTRWFPNAGHRAHGFANVVGPPPPLRDGQTLFLGRNMEISVKAAYQPEAVLSGRAALCLRKWDHLSSRGACSGLFPAASLIHQETFLGAAPSAGTLLPWPLLYPRRLWLCLSRKQLRQTCPRTHRASCSPALPSLHAPQPVRGLTLFCVRQRLDSKTLKVDDPRNRHELFSKTNLPSLRTGCKQVTDSKGQTA